VYEKLRNLSISMALSIDGDKHQSMMLQNKFCHDIQTIYDDSIYFDLHHLLSQSHIANALTNPICTLVYDSTRTVFNYGVRSDSFVDFRNEYKMFPQVLVDSMTKEGIIPR
jgi:hypothetical protein